MSLLEKLNEGLVAVSDIGKEINLLKIKRKKETNTLAEMIPDFFTHKFIVDGSTFYFNIAFHYKTKSEVLTSEYNCINCVLQFNLTTKGFTPIELNFLRQTQDPIILMENITECSEKPWKFGAIVSTVSDVKQETFKSFIEKSAKDYLENIDTAIDEPDYKLKIGKLVDSDKLDFFKAEFSAKINNLINVLTLKDENVTVEQLKNDNLYYSDIIEGLKLLNTKGLKCELSNQLSSKEVKKKSIKI